MSAYICLKYFFFIKNFKMSKHLNYKVRMCERSYNLLTLLDIFHFSFRPQSMIVKCQIL